MVILVGHSVLGDIEALGLNEASYIDTTNIRHKSDQKGKIRKLKDLVKEYLKLEIQESTHSSITDAKATMALFLHFKDSKEAFYGDNTIQSYTKPLKTLKVPAQNKRVKKAERKLEEKSFASKMGWGLKMAVYGLSIYTLQMLANS